MAPPQKPFPVSELEQRILSKTVNFEKEKSRKLPKDFNLKDCELFELVQYSCISMRQQMENAIDNPSGMAPIECFPFVRLFRRCKHRDNTGDKVFHVETTAWEGQYAWQPKENNNSTQKQIGDQFAQYGSYFWSKK